MRTPINPFATIPQYKPVRKKRSKPRRGPWRSAEYRQWLHGQFCAVLVETEDQLVRRGEPLGSTNCDCAITDLIDPAHTENNGMSSKGPDSSCVPLCREHHREYDAGREAFEKKYGVDMKALAAEYYAKWLSETGTEA